MRAVLIIFIISFTIGCKTKEAKQSFRDSVISKYIEMTDKRIDFDTLDPQYKLLKAYVNNDTDYLDYSLKNINQKIKADSIYKANNNCFELEDLRLANIDEGYQFKYEQSFNPYVYYAKITKTAERIKLIIEVSQYTHKSYYGKTSCKVIKVDTLVINENQWRKFEQLLYKADFWGRKETSPYSEEFLDGFSIVANAYKSDEYRFYKKYIHLFRATEYGFIYDIFKYLYGLKGEDLYKL